MIVSSSEQRSIFMQALSEQVGVSMDGVIKLRPNEWQWVQKKVGLKVNGNEQGMGVEPQGVTMWHLNAQPCTHQVSHRYALVPLVDYSGVGQLKEPVWDGTESVLVQCVQVMPIRLASEAEVLGWLNQMQEQQGGNVIGALPWGKGTTMQHWWQQQLQLLCGKYTQRGWAEHNVHTQQVLASQLQCFGVCTVRD